MVNLNDVVLLFGGWTVVLTAIVGVMVKWIAERIFLKWKRLEEERLEILKGNISKNNSLLTNLIDTYSASNQKVQEIRVKAIEILWNSFLEIKSSFPSVISLVYDILTEAERNNLYNSESGDDFRKMLRDISMDELSKKTQIVYEKIEKQRPFLGEKLWFIFYSYYGTVMRSIHHMLKGRDQKKIEHWSKDSGIMQLLGIALSKEEMEYVTKLEFNSYRILKELFEQKVLNEMVKVTSGVKITEDCLKQLKKVECAIREGQRDMPQL